VPLYMATPVGGCFANSMQYKLQSPEALFLAYNAPQTAWQPDPLRKLAVRRRLHSWTNGVGPQGKKKVKQKKGRNGKKRREKQQEEKGKDS